MVTDSAIIWGASILLSVYLVIMRKERIWKILGGMLLVATGLTSALIEETGISYLYLGVTIIILFIEVYDALWG